MGAGDRGDPAAAIAGALSFAMLVALAFVIGIPAGAHFGAQRAIVPELLGENTADVARANAVFQTASRTTYFAGPAGGVLLAAAGAPAVMLVDAATFAVSFVLVATLVPPAPAAEGAGESGRVGQPDDRARLREGLALLRRDGVLRSITVAQFLSQGAFMAMNGAVPVLAFTRYGRDATLAGVLLGVWGGGAMAGGLAALRLVRGRDPLRLGALAWLLQAAPLWALLATPAPGVAIAALALSGLGNGIRVPPLLGVVTVRIPAPLRAGTLTVSSLLVLAAGFLALLAAGPVLDRAGATPVFAAVAAVQTLAAAVVVHAALRAPAGATPPAARPAPRGPRRRGSSATPSG